MFKYLLNNPYDLYLVEIETNCLIIKKAYKTLINQHLYYTDPRCKTTDYTCSPIELLASINLFINSTSIIKKIFFPVPDKNTENKDFTVYRGKKLLNFFSNPQLTHLRKVKVRNSYEHIDDRFDNIFQNHNNKKLVLYDCTKNSNTEDELVIKKFHPVEFTISLEHRHEEINVKKLYEEISLIEQNIEIARKAINQNK